jgi:DNA-binding NtrC family response regulator
MKKKIFIMVVAPYEGLKEVVNTVAPEFSDCVISTEVGNLLEGTLSILNKAEDYCDAIVSRGGTSQLIAKHVSSSIPVIDMGISHYDILRVLMLQKEFSKQVAIIGFQSITNNCRSICALLNYNPTIITLEQQDDIISVLKTLKKQNVHLIIGDVVTTTHAKELGLNSLLLTSGAESVRRAFQAARQIVNHSRTCQYELTKANNIIQASPYPVFAYDSSKQEETHNTLPFHDGFQDISQDKLMPLVTTVMKEGEVNAVLPGENNSSYQVLGKRIMCDYDAMSILYMRLLDMATIPINGISVITTEELSKNHFPWFLSKSLMMKNLQERVSMLSETNFSVLVYGEWGCLMEQLAMYIHCGNKENKEWKTPVFRIDCRRVDPESLLCFAEQHLQSYPSNMPLLLVDLDCLSADGQKALLDAWRAIGARRIFALSERLLDASVQEGEFMENLFRAFDFSEIWIPPLRERVEDMELLANVIIGETNETWGKHVVGLEKSALTLMKDYDWNGNYAQFQKVLSAAAKLSEVPYIPYKSIASLLVLYAEDRHYYEIKNDRTLEEIEREIILEVLKRENMNQARTAKRLGISRTTLWRKLRSAQK